MMIKMCLTVLALLVLFVGSGSASAAIALSDHDFTQGTNNFSTAICEPCHAPHNPVDGGGYLWNHQTTTQTFDPYVTVSGQTGDPGTASLACLSCHDGQTSMDNFGGVTTGIVKMGVVGGNLGIDLKDDHPVGVTFPASGYKAGHTTPLYDSQVECGSCHDVHNGTGIAKMLRITNTGSALCLDCHDK